MSWLEGRGTGFRVPPYLRYDGQVKNLHIDAKMTGEMIADLLRAKEEGSQQETRLSDFLLQFTNLRYSTITLQMEFSYNLVDGLDRFKVSPGELREAIYFHFQSFPHIAMFRDVLYHNISGRVLTRLVNKVFRLRSQLVMTLEKINAGRATKQDWITDSQFKSGNMFFIFITNTVFF